MIEKIKKSRSILLLFLVIGVALRLEQFFINRSLWGDEAVISLNIIDHKFFALLKPVGDGVFAPFGFLATEKIIIKILGFSEYAFRLFPLICGLVSIVVFLFILQKTVCQKSAYIGMFLFAISVPMIYWSSEINKYSTELMFGLLLLNISIDYYKNPTFKNKWLLSFIGAVSIWFAFSSIFVLGAIAVALLINILKSFKQSVNSLMSIFVIWGTSFIIFYFSSHLNEQANAKSLKLYWTNWFLPFPPKGWNDLRWLVENPFNALQNPGGFYLSGLALFIIAIACISLWKKDKTLLSLLTLPTILTLLASALRVWPFYGRLILFLVPFWILLLTIGIDTLRENFKMPFVAFVASLFLIIHPVFNLSNSMYKFYFSEVNSSSTSSSNNSLDVFRGLMSYRYFKSKKAVQFIFKNLKQNDMVYVPHWPSWYQFTYYSKIINQNNLHYKLITGTNFVGSFNKTKILIIKTELKKLRHNGRVWILIPNSTEKNIYLNILNKEGKMILGRDWYDTSVYLYNLSEPVLQKK
jgi:hypothetical protein